MLSHDRMANRLLWTASRNAANADAPDEVWGVALCAAKVAWHTVQERHSAEGRGTEKAGWSGLPSHRMPVRNAGQLVEGQAGKTSRQTAHTKA